MPALKPDLKVIVGATVSVLPLAVTVVADRLTEHCELLSVPVAPGWPEVEVLWSSDSSESWLPAAT